MKVYILKEYFDVGCYDILGVFANQKKAEEALEQKLEDLTRYELIRKEKERHIEKLRKHFEIEDWVIE